ncbi:MAG: hypothetical protein IPK19_11910 [Chloroflexi bacterium]|nr:hypothetical protein [Chloroflexota bacterium]
MRYGTLDAYELTDEEVVALLEVWRWTVWTERDTPADDVRAALIRLQRHLAKEFDTEVEYNTAVLLKQEIEPLLYLRVLRDIPAAILYFVTHPVELVRAMLHARRADVPPLRGQNGEPLGYPRHRLSTRLRAPDLLKRAYFKQLSPFTFAQRKQMDYWW